MTAPPLALAFSVAGAGLWADPGKGEASFTVTVMWSFSACSLPSHQKYQLGLMKPMVGFREKLSVLC